MAMTFPYIFHLCSDNTHIKSRNDNTNIKSIFLHSTGFYTLSDILSWSFITSFNVHQIQFEKFS